VSIPRDSWVPVPGHGMMKINAAFSLGGAPLMIETVEDFTHVRIDHYMVVDFRGLANAGLRLLPAVTEGSGQLACRAAPALVCG
jgi:hypothetical protein